MIRNEVNEQVLNIHQILTCLSIPLQVGCPEGPPAAAHDEMARNHQQLHLLQGHRDSFKHFLTHLFPKQLELVKDQVRLSDNSYVLISEAVSFFFFKS